jgi:cytochrome c-type biogenesis protein CcsB
VTLLANDGLATISDYLFVAAVLSYAFAMLGYAADAASGRRSEVATLAVPERERVLVGAGSADSDLVPTDPLPAVRSAPPRHNWLERFGVAAVGLTILGWLCHASSLAVRGFAEERLPFGNMYEFASAGALAASSAYLVLLTRQKARWLGVAVMFAVVVCMGLAGTVLYTSAGPLVPALHSYWLSIHVTAAIISAGVLTVGSLAAALYLTRLRYDARVAAGREPGLSRIARLAPAPEVLDRTAYRVLAFAFPIWTFAVVAGAIWAESAWGRYWGWDPKETWAFITWVIYAGYLHARSTAGWRGKRAAWVAVFGYLAFLFNFFGVNIAIVGLHSYAGI